MFSNLMKFNNYALCAFVFTAYHTSGSSGSTMSKAQPVALVGSGLSKEGTKKREELMLTGQSPCALCSAI